jgi:glutaredoxin 3
MARVKVYSTGICPICDNTKNLLKKWHIPFEEARVDRDRTLLKEMLELTQGARTVPQIAIDGKWIGGFSDLTMLHMDGKLDDLVVNSDLPRAS